MKVDKVLELQHKNEKNVKNDDVYLKNGTVEPVSIIDILSGYIRSSGFYNHLNEELQDEFGYKLPISLKDYLTDNSHAETIASHLIECHITKSIDFEEDIDIRELARYLVNDCGGNDWLEHGEEDGE